jgi:DMSO/TMAO reductase YedYZ molybdopterin-dependent catalytic subunit
MQEETMPSRRNFIKSLAGALAGMGAGALAPGRAGASPLRLGPEGLPAGTLETAVLDSLRGKEALIKRTYRPPNYETPLEYFDAPYTPNARFFVRYHLAAIPEVDPARWRLKVGGDAAATPVEFTLDDLRRQFEAVELPALCFCAGNRRGLFQPHVPGIQWGDGAMGNALWQGVRLRDVLDKAGIGQDALEIAFDGADAGVLDKTPDFAKSLPLSKALDANTLIAYAMNGEPLPHWNGFPARLVVPGWAATYWVKHLTAINAVSKPLDSFWMKTAYRIPKGKFAVDSRFPSQEAEASEPIAELVVNSLIVAPGEGQRFERGSPVEVKGVAWDGGHGIERVEVSTDGGQNWQPANLDKELGLYSWRLWSFRFNPTQGGPATVMVRATNRRGQTQPAEPVANPAGYHRNAVQTVTVSVA